MPEVVIHPEWLVIEALSPHPAVATATPAWKITDYTPIRNRTRVGEDRPIPGAPGRLYVPREWDEQSLLLTWKINGTWDHEGVLHDDRFEGVDVNHQYLLDHIFNVLDLRDVTFHRRDGATFDGEAVVDDWEASVDPNSEGDHLVGQSLIKIPAGYLEPAGS